MKTLLFASLFTAAAAALPNDRDGARKLLDAIRTGDAQAVDTLLKGDPSLADARADGGVNAVRLAMYYRHPEIARILILQGARLDAYDAASTGELKRLRELIEAKPASVRGYSADGATLLGLAAFFGQRGAVEFLLDQGALIDTPNTNPAFPFVPLHSAMSAGHRGIFDLLLARGADVRVREGGGLTVLHEAAGLGNMDYVKTLLDRGADPAAKTDDGKLPEDFARALKHEAVAEILAAARRR